MPIPRAPATQKIFNEQQYGQITFFIYLEGAAIKTPNLSDETDRRIRVGSMSFGCYMRELYDRPKASLLPLEARWGDPR